MATNITGISPAANSFLEVGDSFTCVIDHTSATEVVITTGGETAWTLTGGAGAGYTIDKTTSASITTINIKRTAGWAGSVVGVSVEVTGGVNAGTGSWQYYVGVQEDYPGKTPYNDTLETDFTVLEDGVEVADGVNVLDFRANLNVTKTGEKRVQVDGTGGGGGGGGGIPMFSNYNWVASATPTGDGNIGISLNTGAPYWGSYTELRFSTTDGDGRDVTEKWAQLGNNWTLVFERSDGEIGLVSADSGTFSGTGEVDKTPGGYVKVRPDWATLWDTGSFEFDAAYTYNITVIAGFNQFIYNAKIEVGDETSPGGSPGLIPGHNTQAGKGRLIAYSSATSETGVAAAWARQNFTATTDPDANDDWNGYTGYAEGSFWYNKLTKVLWLSTLDTNGGAQWIPITGAATNYSLGTNWTFNSLGGTPNSNGEVLPNGATPTLTTQLDIFKTDGAAVDVGSTLLLLNAGDVILWEYGELAVDQYFTLTAPAVDNGTYVTITGGFTGENLDDDYTVGQAYEQATATIGGGFSPRLDGEPNGFVGTLPTLSFDNLTRTLTITGDHTFYSNGTLYQKTTDSIVINDTEGLNAVYYDSNGNLTTIAGFDEDIIFRFAFVWACYWDAVNNVAITTSGWDEMHGASMAPATHSYLHWTRGATWRSGMLVTATSDGNGSLAAHAQYANAAGQFHDEDILHEVAAKIVTDNIDFLYRSGLNGEWRMDSTADYLVKTAGTGRAAYNQNVSGSVWQLTEVTNNDYVLAHVYAVPGVNRSASKTVVVAGQTEYASQAAAFAGAESEIKTLEFGGLPGPEFMPLATFILQTSNAFSNAVKSAIVSTESGDDYIDWRITLSGGGSTGGTNDPDAIHDNVAGEIAAVAAATVASGDFVLIEDADDSNNKKRTTAGDIAALAAASSDFRPGLGTWLYDTTTTGAGISNGDFRVDNATITSGTNIFIAKTSRELNMGAVLDDIDGYRIFIVSSDGTEVLLALIGTAVDNSTYYTLPITGVVGDATFTNNKAFSVNILPPTGGYGGGGGGGGSGTKTLSTNETVAVDATEVVIGGGYIDGSTGGTYSWNATWIYNDGGGASTQDAELRLYDDGGTLRSTLLLDSSVVGLDTLTYTNQALTASATPGTDADQILNSTDIYEVRLYITATGGLDSVTVYSCEFVEA